MRRIVLLTFGIVAVTGCGPPRALRDMHEAFNTGNWAGVTERFADMGRPKTLDGIAYARVADSAAKVYAQLSSPAYRDLAMESYELAARKDSSLADEYHFATGELLERAGDKEGAIRAYRDALAANPRNVSAACRAVALLLAAGRPAEAVTAGQGLAKVRTPVNPLLLYGLLGLSLAYADAGNPDAALDVLRRASEVGPAEWAPDIMYGVAQYHQKTKDNGRARAMMRQAMSLLPDGDRRREPFGQYLQALEGNANALAAPGSLPPAVSSMPSPAAPPRTSQTPRKPATRQATPAATPHDPAAQAASLAVKAATLSDQGKVAEAIALLEQAVALAPRQPAPAAQLAVLHVKAGNLAAAKAVLEKSLSLNPDNQVLKTMLGRLQAAGEPSSQPGS